MKKNENGDKQEKRANLKLSIAFWANNIYSAFYIITAWIKMFDPTLLNNQITQVFIYVIFNTFYSGYKGILRRRYGNVEKRQGDFWIIIWFASTILMVGVSWTTTLTLTWETVGLFSAVLANYLVTEWEKWIYQKNQN